MKKKVLAMVLAVLLIISILPVSALAADTPETYYWAVLKYKGTDKKTAAEYPKLIISSDKISVGADFEYYTTGDADAMEDQKAGHGTFLSTFDANKGLSRDEKYYGFINIPWRLRFYPKLKTVSVTGNVRPVSTAHWFSCVETWNSEITDIDMTGLDTSKVTDMSWMFAWCYSLEELDVSSFDTSKVADMSGMFDSCESLEELNLSGFDTSNVTDMRGMLCDCDALTELDVSGWDTSKVTDMACMFEGCRALTELDLRTFDTSDVTDMCWMFANCDAFKKLDVSGWDTSNVTNMGYMFYNCVLAELDVSGWDTSKVTDMGYMFHNCALTELDIGSFNTCKVTNMCWMFTNCDALKKLNVSGWDTSMVTDMCGMFDSCSAITELDISGWDMSKVTYMYYMFSGCANLKKLALPEYDYPEDAFEYGTLDVVYTAGTKPLENAQGSIANIVLNGGEIDGFEDGYISVPTQSGKVFKGYFADSAFTAEIKPNTNGKYAEPTTQTTYYAKWEDIPDGGYASCKKDGTCPMSGYTDVKTGAWYHDGVHYCLENGLMNGVGKNTFAPNGTTSRAMIVTILYRLEGEPAFMNDSVFRDVASGSWYEKAVVWASGKGIVGGYGDGKFGPDDPVTREQLAAILYRYAKYKEQDVSVDENTNFLSFNDFFNISEYAKPAMMWAIYNGLIEGDNWDLTPQGSASRAQVAAILQRYCENTAK